MMKNIEMKSIKTKILVVMGVTVAVFVLLVGFISILINYRSSNEQLELSMSGTVRIAAERVEYELVSYSNIAVETGMRSDIADPQISVSQKESIINNLVEEYGFQRGNILDQKGDSLFDGNNYADREYFKEAMKGNPYISTPVVSKVTDELTIMIAAPIWKNGKAGTTAIGAVYFVPNEDFLNDIMTSMTVSENSGGYMIDKNGYTIADTTADTVEDGENIEQEAQNDSSLETLAAIHQKMKEGNSGFGTYELDGTKNLIAYAPVNNTDGWSLAVRAPLSDFQAATKQGIIIMIVLILVSLGAAYIISRKLAKRIADPIHSCADRLLSLSQGDLHTPVPEINTNDETGTLVKSTHAIVKCLNQLIQEESSVLGAMAEGNFNIQTKDEVYVGDLSQISEAIHMINDKLNQTLSEIDIASAQVSSGSEQVAAGAQALSQGATEQASSIEELAATIDQISKDIQKTAENAQDASDSSQKAGNALIECDSKMQELLSAMEAIRTSSHEIEKIIKTIEDIAFQTNILALNAAVEAARAGTAGKGFAVVADEVRNLASKSSEASQSTSSLIEHSIRSVENGTRIANETAQSMAITAECAEEAVSSIHKISKAAADQSESLTQITQGIDQISSVIQTNSATAQESAAASEELSGQADMLKSLVAHFTLKQEWDSDSFVTKDSTEVDEYNNTDAVESLPYEDNMKY